MTSASPCGMSHEPGLASSFSDDPSSFNSSLNQPASPTSRGIPPLISITGNRHVAAGQGSQRLRAVRRTSRRVAASAGDLSSPQLLDLTFLTIFHPGTFPNPLIARVCTPLHINQKGFLAPVCTRSESANKLSLKDTLRSSRFLNFPHTPSLRPLRTPRTSFLQKPPPFPIFPQISLLRFLRFLLFRILPSPMAKALLLIPVRTRI